MKASTEGAEDLTECPNCARVVPVPKRTSLSGTFAGCAPSFPHDVLDLEVKFLCASCKNRLRADARWEGRSIVCPICSEKTRVPKWSDVSRWPAAPAGAKAASDPGDSAAVTLSPDEIAFLSDPAPPGRAGAS